MKSLKLTQTQFRKNIYLDLEFDGTKLICMNKNHTLDDLCHAGERLVRPCTLKSGYTIEL